MKRSRLKPSGKRTDYSAARAKVEDEGGFCRVCGTSQRVEAAHTIGKEFQDRIKSVSSRRGTSTYVPPEAIVPLCGPATTSSTCHGKLHAHRLNLLPYMTYEEQANAVQAVGMESAYKRLTGGTT